MTSSFEKSVKGATKIKALPPKTKYIEHILIATHSGETCVAEVFRALANRLRESTWTVVFKSLITVHLMIREGAPDVTLAYLGRHRHALSITGFSDVQTQGRNIRHYANYLTQRSIAYRETKFDFVRGSEGRLEKLSVDKGVLREAEILQHQIAALLKCDVLENEPENEITITVFRMLILDLLVLNKVYNEALINILGHFFEMSKPDAERAMEIYRNFTTQNNYVLNYLAVARQYEMQTRVHIPKFKHAPVTLGKQLEEYLKDPDFEINRRQYLAEQEAKKSRNRSNSATTRPFLTNKKDAAESRAAAARAFPDTNQQASGSSQPVRKPDTDLIDFFESIERPVTAYIPQHPQHPQQQQQQFGVQQPQQFIQSGFVSSQNGFHPQEQFQQYNNNGYVPQPQQLLQQPSQQNLQQSFTGAGFGGYTPQQPFQPSTLSSIPQDSGVSTFQTQAPTSSFPSMPSSLQQTTNPFRQSMVATSTPGFSSLITPADRQSTNPFAKGPPTAAPHPDFRRSAMHSTESLPNQFHAFDPQGPSVLAATPTGTNPFARTMTAGPVGAANGNGVAPRPQTSGGLMSQPTGAGGGSTNPFRQTSFAAAGGNGWQGNHHGGQIGTGFGSLETVPVFPRQVSQQQQQQQPWG